MLDELSFEMRFLICCLAVWRLTHLFVAEDGPLDVIFQLRKILGNSIAGKAMDCFYCSSVWLALPFALVVSTNWFTRFICWMALSGAASLLEQVTSKKKMDNQNEISP